MRAERFFIAVDIRKAIKSDARYLQTDPLFSTYWNPARDAELAYLGEIHHLAGTARVMRVSSQKVAQRAKLLGLELLTQEQASTPTKGEWIGAATKEAIAACIAPIHVLRGSRVRTHIYARWRAWQRLLDENPNYCPKGIATVSGFDYSTVSNGLWRLRSVKERDRPNTNASPAIAFTTK